MHWKKLLLIATPVAVLALAGAALVATAKSTPSDHPAAVVQPAAVVHPAGLTHQLMPKRLQTVVEMDMAEFAFASPDGQSNPTFRIPAGKTVGIHLHNEGSVVHELVMGRKPAKLVETDQSGTKVVRPDGYDTMLFDELEADVFFYYGEAKAEIGGARFEELEVDPGIKDIWLRLQFPPELKGEWELGCFVPGHYEAGMHATLIVE